MSVIDYFDSVFKTESKMSAHVHGLFDEALRAAASSVLLSIPSVVFLEVFEKWLVSEEQVRRFYYEVYERIRASPNIEIRPIDWELVETVMSIGENLLDHELHDKIVVAAGIVLECRIVTCDREIQEFVKRTNCVPGTLY